MMNKFMEVARVLWSFVVGGLIVFTAVSHNWINFGVLVLVAIPYVVTAARLNLQRLKVQEAGIEMRKMLEHNEGVIEQMLVDNVRAYAVVAVLLGGKLHIEIEEVRDGDAYPGRARQNR